MSQLAPQLLAILQPRMTHMGEAAKDVADEINTRMQENTAKGTSWPGATYINTYDQKYANRAKGGNTSPVTLRNRSTNIAGATAKKEGKDSAVIRFAKQGDIFLLHHTGRARGDKIRTIFPKRIEHIPDEVKKAALLALKGVLSGQ